MAKTNTIIKNGRVALNNAISNLLNNGIPVSVMELYLECSLNEVRALTSQIIDKESKEVEKVEEEKDENS